MCCVVDEVREQNTLQTKKKKKKYHNEKRKTDQKLRHQQFSVIKEWACCLYLACCVFRFFFELLLCAIPLRRSFLLDVGSFTLNKFAFDRFNRTTRKRENHSIRFFFFILYISSLRMPYALKIIMWPLVRMIIYFS